MASEADLAEVLAEALSLDLERAKSLLSTRATRLMSYKGLKYIVLRREISGHPEGTAVVLTREGYRVIDGYPPIRRVLLLGVAVPRHFLDDVVVEEKMDGYNVRVTMINGELYAFTRGGYICPYTTYKVKRTYGKQLRSLFDKLGEDTIVAGEAVGLENPYARHYYPEAPGWDIFIIDIFKGGLEALPVADRRSLVEESGLRNVPQLGVYPKDDWHSILEVVEGLEEVGREGVVLKDPYYRVPPLKYTTAYTNTADIEAGMRYPFDEGRTFIFPRVLRQIFKAYEDGWDEERLRLEAERLGMALLAPALESLNKAARGEEVAEEFTLTFDSLDDLEDFISYSASMGVPLTVAGVDYDGRTYRANLVKPKRTLEEYRRILRTGLSPLD